MLSITFLPLNFK